MSNDLSDILERFNLDPNISENQRRLSEENMHYIGFDNATLLRLNHETRKKRLYTTGIIGCNALVLSSNEGTYMSHIAVDILDRSSRLEIYQATKQTLESFADNIGERPLIARVISGEGRYNENLMQSLESLGIDRVTSHQYDQYRIKVGSGIGFNNFNVRPELIDDVCIRNNLLPGRLQWPTLIQSLKPRHYMKSTISSDLKSKPTIFEEARNISAPVRQRLTIPINEKNYMKPTTISKLRAKPKIKDKIAR